MVETDTKYSERLAGLDSAINSCIAVSRKYMGIPAPTARHLYASTLFTSLCTKGVSFITLLPHNTWAKHNIEHWDFSTAANIARTILETRLTFYYLCIEQCSEDEWNCRWNVLNLHDCKSRIALFEKMGSSNAELDGFRGQLEELKDRLSKNDFFTSLPKGQKSSILNGGKAHIYSLEEIFDRSGFDRQQFKWLYQFLSAQVHGLPLSFYRMDSGNRGRGLHSDVEESYTCLCMSLSISMLVCARDEMEKLFEGVAPAATGS